MMLTAFSRPMAVLVLLLGLAGCAAYSLVAPAKVSVAGMQVDVEQPWNKANQLTVTSSGAIEVWTADGPALNTIMFIGGARDGEVAVKSNNPNASGTAIFRASMSPAEIVELWETVIVQQAGTTIAKGGNIKPVKHGGIDGFTFEFAYTGKNEVEQQGLGYAAIKDKRLYMIFFSGTKLHHYGSRRASVEKMIETVRIAG